MSIFLPQNFGFMVHKILFMQHVIAAPWQHLTTNCRQSTSSKNRKVWIWRTKCELFDFDFAHTHTTHNHIPHFNRQNCWPIPFFLHVAINVAKTIIRMIKTSFFWVIYFVTLEEKKMFYDGINKIGYYTLPISFQLSKLFWFFFHCLKYELLFLHPINVISP